MKTEYASVSSKRLFTLGLAATLLLASKGAWAKDWTPQETGAIDRATCEKFGNPRFVKRPLSGGGTFDLFHYSPTGIAAGKPTILIVDGGPGGITSPKRTLLELERYGWANLVFYHIRGAGCSQLPASDKHDVELTPQADATDIEAIRQDLGIKSWSLVYGASYGTYAAQQYATDFPGSVKAMYLEGVFLGRQEEGEIKPWETSGKTIARLARAQAAKGRIRLSAQQLDSLEASLKGIHRDFDGTPLLEAFESSDFSFFNLFDRATWEDFVKAFPALEKDYGWIFDYELTASVIQAEYTGYRAATDWIAPFIDSFGVIAAEHYFPGSADPAALKLARETLTSSIWAASAAAASAQSVPAWAASLPLGSRRNTGTMLENNSLFGLEHLAPYAAKTLLVAGDADGATPTKAAETAFAKLVTDGALMTVRGGGHSRMFPEACKVRLLRHLVSKRKASTLKKALSTEECASWSPGESPFELRVKKP